VDVPRTRVPVVVAVVAVVAAVAGPVAAAGAGGAASGAGAQADCEFPVTRTDATGTLVSLPAEPERVVTLNPSAAQTMWEIGARSKVVGLTKYATYLDGAETRTNVSTAGAIVSVEAVVGLEPDLVIAPNATDVETVERLREAGLTVYHFPEARTLGDVAEKTRVVGRLVGACEGAATTVEGMESDLAVVEEAVVGRERPDVIYTFFGFTAGSGTFIHRIIETAGGNNVAADANITGYREVNPELLVERDPDWIIRNSNTPTVPRTAAYNSTTAVREGQVVVVPIEHLNQPAPRVVRAVTLLARTFHPEAYAAANATATATATATPTPEPTPSPTATPTPTPTPAAGTTASSAPGFGLGTAVAGLALAAGLVRRRCGGWR
jgi:iron complex transport system substrate-binding protein